MDTNEPLHGNQPAGSGGAEAGADAPLGSVAPLRRRAADRVVGGVAGGIADYLRVDPLLVRAVFAGLMVFGGAGLVIYVIAWLLIPGEADRDSIAVAVLRRVGVDRPGPMQILAILLMLELVLVVALWRSPVIGPEGAILVAIAIIVAGLVLLTRWGSSIPGAPPPPSAVAPAASWAATPEARPAAPPARAARPPRERSALGWYVVAAMLATGGLLALAQRVLGLELTVGQHLGAVVAVLGAGLVVGAWWGRARLLILLGLVLLPVTSTAALLGDVPLEGGMADLGYRPQSTAELRPEYRLVGGALELDLVDLTAGAEPVRIAASVAVGDLVVTVPEDARVELDAHVGAGRLLLFGVRQIGTSLDDRVVREGAGGPTLILDLGTGIGQVRVHARPAGG